jgi:hypothetical protein
MWAVTACIQRVLFDATWNALWKFSRTLNCVVRREGFIAGWKVASCVFAYLHARCWPTMWTSRQWHIFTTIVKPMTAGTQSESNYVVQYSLNLYIYIFFSPNRAVNTLRLSYTNQSVNVVQWNNRCLFWDPHKTHKYSPYRTVNTPSQLYKPVSYVIYMHVFGLEGCRVLMHDAVFVIKNIFPGREGTHSVTEALL